MRARVIGSLAAVACVAAFGLSAPAALALSPGDLDPNFGSGGTVMQQFGMGASPSSEAWAVATQPDGKIVLGGQATDTNGRLEVLVARMNPGGGLDPSFGSGGVFLDQVGAGSTPRSLVEGVVVERGGKIVVGGQATDAGGNNELMALRLNPGGSLDSSFGSGGVFRDQLGIGVHPSSRVNFNSILLQNDKIVLGGEATDNHSSTQFTVLRLNPDGSLDSSFGSGGVVLRQFGFGTSPRSRVTSLALQADGKILAGGDGENASGAGAQDFLVARLNGADGSLDSSFGTGGVVEQDLGSGSRHFSGVFAVKEQNDGKIMAGGDLSDSSDNELAMLARLNPDGSFDSSFGSSGVISNQYGASSAFGLYSQVFNLVLQPNGKIVTGMYVSGDAVSLSYGSKIARFNPDGSLDSSFGSGGLVDPVQLPASSTSWADQDGLAFEPDGNVLASGDDSIGGGQAWITRMIGDPAPTASLTASPNPGGAGQAISFNGSAPTDPNGAIPSYTWNFGDGAVATGASAHHAYANAGVYTVKFMVTYDGGVVASASKTVTVLGPRLTHLSQSHRRWREGSKLPHIASARPPVGTTFRFTINQSVRVRFAFKQRLPGRRVGVRCVAPTAKNRGRPKCTRLVSRGSLSFSVKAGAHRLRFQGRISKHKRLPIGRYTVVITATNSAGQRATAKLTFTIVRG